jgi:hypothetical protein
VHSHAQFVITTLNRPEIYALTKASESSLELVYNHVSKDFSVILRLVTDLNEIMLV